HTLRDHLLSEEYHASCRRKFEGDRRPRILFDIDHAEAALPGNRQPGVVAVVRDFDAETARRLDEVRAGLDLDLFAVDAQLRHRANSEGGFAPLPTPLAHSARGCLPPGIRLRRQSR